MYTIDMATNNGWVELATIDGCEAAYAAYRKACELGSLLGRDVALCYSATSQVITCLSDEEEAEIPMPEAGDLAEAWWEG